MLLLYSCFVALFLIAGCVKLIVNTEYNVNLLKVTLTLGLMFAVCIYSFVKAMTYEFLGWQLRNEAHSEEEFGTLRHLLTITVCAIHLILNKLARFGGA